MPRGVFSVPLCLRGWFQLARGGHFPPFSLRSTQASVAFPARWS